MTAPTVLTDAAIQRRIDAAKPHIRQAVEYANKAESADVLRRAYFLDLHATAMAEAARVIGGAS